MENLILCAVYGKCSSNFLVEHYESMIMQNLDDATTYKKLDFSLKIHKNLRKLLNKHRNSFT